MRIHRGVRFGAMFHTIGALLAAIAITATLATAGLAQSGKPLADLNAVTESELQAMPRMSVALAKGLIERRPFKSIVDVNKFLVDQKLTGDQVREFYRAAFVKIDLNAGSREEFMLIPGVGSRMAAELAEYRPWKTWSQFDKEIGKYVGQQETDRIKQYVYIPPG
jgi:DNA uptake protein ComE-like DNA-binding protein